MDSPFSFLTHTLKYGGVFKDPHRKDEFLKYLSLDI